MRTRYSWKMRMVAVVALVATGGLPYASLAAQAETVKQNVARSKPHYASELPAGRTDKLTAAQWAKVDARTAREKRKPAFRRLTGKEMRRIGSEIDAILQQSW